MAEFVHCSVDVKSIDCPCIAVKRRALPKKPRNIGTDPHISMSDVYYLIFTLFFGHVPAIE